jgi:hypothetical protein
VTEQGRDPNQPNPYEPLPSMPPPADAELAVGRSVGPTGPLPTAVDRASKILYLLAAYGVVTSLLGLLRRDSIEDSVRDSQPDLTDAEVSSAVTVALVLGVIVGLAFAFLYFLCGRKMRDGRNWARVTPTVLLGLAVAFGLLGLANGSGGGEVGIGLQIVTIALGIAFLVFSWSRESNEFFAARRRPRYQ